MKDRELKSRRAHVLYSPLGVRTYYSRSQIRKMWQGRRIRFFFAWDSRQVFMVATTRDESRIFEPVRTMTELLERSRRDADNAG